MRRAWHLARNGGEERRIQDFAGESCGKETIWETQA